MGPTSFSTSTWDLSIHTSNRLRKIPREELTPRPVLSLNKKKRKEKERNVLLTCRAACLAQGQPGPDPCRFQESPSRSAPLPHPSWLGTGFFQCLPQFTSSTLMKKARVIIPLSITLYKIPTNPVPITKRTLTPCNFLALYFFTPILLLLHLLFQIFFHASFLKLLLLLFPSMFQEDAQSLTGLAPSRNGDPAPPMPSPQPSRTDAACSARTSCNPIAFA